VLQQISYESPAKLVGIARMAAQGSLLTEKSRVEYRTLPTRKWLNRCHSDRVPFHWTINPYRGCEYGCKYCYARFTHEFLERRDPAAFETEIYAKDWDPLAFQEELKAVKPGHVIGLGTATDPYQPAERKFGRTKQVLEALTALRGASLFVTTKSDLVSRDTALFAAISKHNDVRITVSVTTTNRKLARLIEPYAPRPDLRLKAVAALAQAGVAVGVIASPILPLITDSEKSLTAVAESAKAAGARSFGGNLVFLQPAAQRVFFPFLAEKFPRHLARYEKNFEAGAYLKGAYPRRIGELLTDIRSRVGIGARDFLAAVDPDGASPQLLLF
jgi:DNA repair photolyase